MKNCRAFIRTDRDVGKSCPFNLPIPNACEHAGDSTANMCPLQLIKDEQKQERVIKANKRVYIYNKTDSRCIYAADIIKSKDAVNCDFGDTGAGMGMSGAFTGSPLYPQMFSGVGLDGLYAFPLGLYADNSQSRNLFQGLFSLVGSYDVNIIKNALLEEEWLIQINKKLENNEPLTTDEQLNLVNFISDCRQEYEDNRTDSAKADELARKWNPRKGL